MNIFVPVILCFILYITVFAVLALLVPGMKIRYELWASLLGLLAVLPIAFVEYVVLSLPVFTSHTFASVMITALIFNGLIEETLKMCLMLLMPSKKLTLQMFFACSLICGLALGSFESVIYFLKHLQETGIAGSLALYKLIIIRMFSSVIIHTLCAGLSGLYVWSFHQRKTTIIPFIYAFMLHGLYNFFSGFSSGFKYFAIAVLFLAAVECRIRYLKQKNSLHSVSLSLDKISHKH